MPKKLSEKAKAARAAYLREWYRKNPEKNREYKATYWERKAHAAQQEQEANTE